MEKNNNRFNKDNFVALKYPFLNCYEKLVSYCYSDALEFLDYYIRNYDNIFSKYLNTFNLDFSRSRVLLSQDEINEFYNDYIQGFGEYFGIIYKITYNKRNKNRIGKTILTFKKRWNIYKSESFRVDDNNEYINNTRFNRVIRKSLNESDSFSYEILDFCYNEQDLSAKEIFWQLYFFRADNEDGYDLRKGYNEIIGDFDGNLPLIGNKSPSWIDIPTNELDSMLRKSITIDLQKAPLTQIAHHFNVSKETILDRIKRDYRNPKTGYSLTYMELRYQFIKEAIEPLIKKGYRKINIAPMIGLDGNRVAEQKIGRWCQIIYNMSFTKIRLKLLKERIAAYIVDGYDYDKMIEFFPALSRMALRHYVINFWGGYNKARLIYFKLIFKDLILFDASRIQIQKMLNIVNLDNIAHKLWDMTYAQARDSFTDNSIGKNPTYDDVLEFFNRNRDRYIRSLLGK
jgi:hypothetical protein